MQRFGSHLACDAPPPPPQVRKHVAGDYAAAAAALDGGGFDAVILQHEFGIYGGAYGEFVLELARAAGDRAPRCDGDP